MSKPKVAINGFGRIGRAAFKAILNKNNAEIVAINDLTDTKTLANLLKYDSVYGRYDKDISYDDGHLVVDGVSYRVLSEKDPANLPWQELGVDVVLECTGVFRTKEKASAHLQAGARAVIISAPAKDEETQTVVLGVNAGGEEKVESGVLSNASCTTNCIAPVAQIMQSHFGVQKALMTTIHAYTADQRLVDAPHRDLRRGRAAAQNIVPTTTGAAIATGKTVPELAGIFDGLAIRVPVICGSLADFTFLFKRKTTVEEVNKVLQEAAQSDRFKGILEVTDEPLVSSDIVGRSASSIVDLSLTKVIDGDLVKVVAWYDNEWGYANRLVEMVNNIAF